MRILNTGYLLVAYASLNVIVLLSIFISPSIFWPSLFLAYLVVPLFFLNLLVCVVFFVRKPRRASSLLILCFVIVALPLVSKVCRRPKAPHDTTGSISILNHNVKLFRKSGVYNQFSGELIEWIAKDSSDIKCIQEFSTNSRWKELDIQSKIESAGYFSFIYKASSEIYGEHNPGMAIFSKYPILEAGLVDSNDEGINSMIYSDLLLGQDTIRIYNVHLTSYMFDQISPDDSFVEKRIKALQRVINTVAIHTNEIELLMKHMKLTNHPVLIAGDFNEVSLSYNLNRLSSLNNAFEERGGGFGFTLSMLPLFLKIDHILLSKEFNIQRYDVDYTMDISDHYPQRCWFEIKDWKNY